MLNDSSSSRSPSPDPSWRRSPSVFGGSQFSTSSARDEPLPSYSSSSSQSHQYIPLELLTPAPSIPKLNPAYEKYNTPLRKEIFPGVLDDNTITVRHPYVDIYLSNVERAPNDKRWSAADDDFFGYKSKKMIETRSVQEVLQLAQGVSITEKDSDCIFALAALKVFYHPVHPAHFTFWGKATGKKTAKRVEKVLYMDPPMIASPVGWMGFWEMLSFIDGYQTQHFPPTAGMKKVGGMSLRKRKAKEDASPSAPTDPQPDAELTPVRPRTKRVRTATTANATPSRQSTRKTSSINHPNTDLTATTSTDILEQTPDEDSPLSPLSSTNDLAGEDEEQEAMIDGGDDVADDSRLSPTPLPTTATTTTRKARRKRSSPATSASTPLVSSIPLDASPSALTETALQTSGPAPKRRRPNPKRARSSSSSANSSATAVSVGLDFHAGSVSAGETVVGSSPEVEDKLAVSLDQVVSRKGGSRKRKLDDIASEERDEEEVVTARVSQRKRRSSAKSVMARESAEAVKAALSAVGVVGVGKKVRKQKTVA